jgi:hypothetical protein
MVSYCDQSVADDARRTAPVGLDDDEEDMVEGVGWGNVLKRRRVTAVTTTKYNFFYREDRKK